MDFGNSLVIPVPSHSQGFLGVLSAACDLRHIQRAAKVNPCTHSTAALQAALRVAASSKSLPKHSQQSWSGTAALRVCTAPQQHPTRAPCATLPLSPTCCYSPAGLCLQAALS